MTQSCQSIGRVLLFLLAVLALVGTTGPTDASAQDNLATPDWDTPRDDLPSANIVVYYFHHTFRCQTCLALEEMAEEMIRDDFAEELQSGLLAWRAVNMQKPEQEHFATHYGLDGPSLVITEWADSGELRWTNLKRIWELTESPVDYRAYVHTELQNFLQGDAAVAADSSE